MATYCQITFKLQFYRQQKPKKGFSGPCTQGAEKIQEKTEFKEDKSKGLKHGHTYLCLPFCLSLILGLLKTLALFFQK